MSDRTLQDAQSSGVTGLSPKADPRDVADIDRELEAYLREKQLGRPIDLDHSVDAQLSRIKEKIGSRPAKGASAPSAAPSTPTPTPTPSPAKEQSQPEPQAGKAPLNNSHLDLIRSLEEKYSAGKSTGPQNKKEVVTNQEAPQAASASQPVVAREKTERPQIDTPDPREEPVISESQPQKSGILLDLEENIVPRDANKVAELLSLARGLSDDDQESLSKAFLPRFKRNKERKELFERTQIELEKELQSFINNRMSAKKDPSGVAAEDRAASLQVSEVSKPEMAKDNSAQPAPRSEAARPAPAPAQAEVVRETQERKQFDVLDSQRGAKEDVHTIEQVQATDVYDPFMQLSKEKETSQEPAEEAVEVPQKPAPRFVPEESTEKAPAEPEPIPASTPTTEQVVSPQNEDLVARYKNYLSNLEKKPTVLLYDPSQGFVRKAVDPNDPSLNLSYSIDEADQVAVLQVFDANGALLSEIKTPLGEL